MRGGRAIHDLRRPSADRAEQLQGLRICRAVCSGLRQNLALAIGIAGAAEQHGEPHVERGSVRALLTVQQWAQRDGGQGRLTEARKPSRELFAQHRIFTEQQRAARVARGELELRAARSERTRQGGGGDAFAFAVARAARRHQTRAQRGELRARPDAMRHGLVELVALQRERRGRARAIAAEPLRRRQGAVLGSLGAERTRRIPRRGRTELGRGFVGQVVVHRVRGTPDRQPRGTI